MDVHHPDMQIITPRIAHEVFLHDVETILDDMLRDLMRKSSFAMFRDNLDAHQRIARKAAEIVQTIHSRDWADRRVA
jgi:hypothetical protein